MKTKILLANLLFSLSFILTAQIIHVPGNQPTIQAGINAANNGDTVLVAENTYFENIRFYGKAITVASLFLIDGDEDHIDNTIIDGSSATNPDSASTVMFVNGEDTTSIICGFTIQEGTGLLNSTWDYKYGGGIACWESWPKITHNKIKDNMITDLSLICGGVGIGSFSLTGNGWMVVDNNEITNNVCIANAEYTLGGGVFAATNVIIRFNTIENNSCYNDGDQAHSGGIKVQQPTGATITAIIHDNNIQNNTVEGYNVFGGGIMIFQASASISNNNILINEVIALEDGYGAGIYIYQPGGEIQIMNNEINNNSCVAEEYAYGGGIYTYESGETYIINNEVLNNKCDANICYGGGFYCNSIGVLNIIGNEFWNNEMTGVEYWLGAGLYIRDFYDFIHIADNHFKENGGNNISWSCGGALVILNTSDKEVIFEKNIIDSNYAKSGAGIYIYNSYDVKIQNNVFRENYAYEYGGGIRFWQYLGDKDNLFPGQNSDQMSDNYSLNLGDTVHPLIINNAFFDNSAGIAGGAIASNHGLETPVILNSIFWENNSNIGKDIYNESENDIIVSYSDIDTTEINTPWTGENNILVDPLFIDDSCHIADTSQCIEAGVTSIEIFGEMYNCPDIDIDGQPRPLNETADIGVNEVLITNITKRFIKTENPVSLNIYPNPFSSTTTIELSTLTDNFISLEVYDITGKKIEILLSEELSKGDHIINWNAENLNEGIYFIRVKTNTASIVRKVIILE
jgi:hypothetical protein